MTKRKVENKTITIGEMSERHGVTLRTLRFYEDKGFLHPLRMAEGGGGVRNRFYGEDDSRILGLIQEGKNIGLTLLEIGNVLKRSREPWTLRELPLTEGEITEQIEALERGIEASRASVGMLRETLARRTAGADA